MKLTTKERALRIKKRVADIRERVAHRKKYTLQERVRIVLGAIRFYPKAVALRFVKDDGLFLSAGMGFAIITCVIPLLLLLASLLGTILESKTIIYEHLEDLLGKIFTAKTYSETVRQTLTSIIEEIVSNSTGFGLVAAFTLIWTSTNLFAFTRSSLHRIYRVTQTKNIFMSILEDIGWVLALAVLFLLINGAMWMFSLVHQILDVLPKAIQQRTLWFEYSFSAITIFGLFVAMFFIIYRYVPDERVQIKPAFISALTTAILWQITGWIFSWYFTKFPALGKIYGAYTFLIVSFLWIYFSCITFVIGGEVGQLYREKNATLLSEEVGVER
ncbi:MAG: YihY/virulence factor BrkB family protein [Ignavibacteriales bacterium]|nr:YihY/virulence factor BrkB family protein [Ignavibacteriales bacterium]